MQRAYSAGKLTARPVSALGVATLLAALLAALLAGCADGTSGVQTLDGRPSAEPTPSQAAVAPVQAVDGRAAQLVLRAYEGYWAAQVKAYAAADAQGAGLSTYATGAALSDSYANVLRLHRSGRRMTGAPRSSPRVTATGTDRATLTDCLDVSAWKQTGAASGTAPSRYVVQATARRLNGVWLIDSVTRHTDQPC
jgi:hypothetical protein